MKKISPYDICSTMYVPAMKKNLQRIALGELYPQIKSIIICLEDSILENDLHIALKNVQQTLHLIAADHRPWKNRPIIFIRPRTIEVAQILVNNPRYNLSCVHGFVLPKFRHQDLHQWLAVTHNTHLQWMPVLESKEVYDVTKMNALADDLEKYAMEQILLLRIGGNDLMSVLSLRRPKNATLYDGPLDYVIKMLVSVFASRGFQLTSPVCEIIDNSSILQKELELDLLHGLVGKTAVHPSQIELINNAFKVEETDYQEACKILSAEQAVFKSNGAMCEPATHFNWAIKTVEQAKHCGRLCHNDDELNYLNA